MLATKKYLKVMGALAIVVFAATSTLFLYWNISGPKSFSPIRTDRIMILDRSPNQLMITLMQVASNNGLTMKDVGANLPISRMPGPAQGREVFFVQLEGSDYWLTLDNFEESGVLSVYLYSRDNNPHEELVAWDGFKVFNDIKEFLSSKKTVGKKVSIVVSPHDKSRITFLVLIVAEVRRTFCVE